MKSKIIKSLTLLFLFSIFTWLAGFIIFSASILSLKSELHKGYKTDAIVVLTGGQGRIYEGLSLLEKGNAKMLFISGVDKSVKLKDLISKWNGDISKITCCTTLGYQAKNTRDNAFETNQWMESNGFVTLRLVTSDYHIPRAHLEFNHKMPYSKIINHPVKTDHKNKLNLMALSLKEYNKTILTCLRNLFDKNDAVY